MWLSVTNVPLVLIKFWDKRLFFAVIVNFFTRCDFGYNYGLNVKFET